MKKFDMIIAASLLTYLVVALLLGFYGQRRSVEEDTGYKVEINQIMQGLENAVAFSEPDLRGMQYVKAVDFLPVEQLSAESKSKSEPVQGTTQETIQDIRPFYQNHNRVNSTVYPLIIGEKLTGYVRFDYVTGAIDRRILWLAEGMLFVSWLLTFVVLLYVRQRILKPFHVISQMPYELAKGHLQVDAEENRGRFFGKFVWGISMLRDTLDASRGKALKLEKEKKLMLLSISHDIKIPLSAIKLYAKALRDEIYTTKEQRDNAASQIESHAQEIEEFVAKIMSTASEDIIEIEVVNSEFYLRDYIDKVREIYEPKCRIVMTDFVIDRYENKLLQGDIDRAVEVMENLMENAMKYGDGQKISITFYEEDYCQVVEVYNTGTPMEQKELPHLFDSFYRGSNAQDKSGNGLGLYISRQIMLKMEGDIFVKKNETEMCFGLVFRMS